MLAFVYIVRNLGNPGKGLKKTICDGIFGAIVPYIWLDQDLKVEMGY